MNTSLPQVAHVASITDESTRVRTLALDLHLQAEPGQFIMAWLPGLDEKPFSLVRAEPVTLTIARVGPFSSAVHALDSGDRLWIRGPLGAFFQLPAVVPPTGALLLVGGGYGVAPLHFLSERALSAGWRVDMIIGAKTAEDVIFVERFQTLGAKVAITTDDGSLGQHGVATDTARRLLDQGAYQALYGCGPEPMLQAVETLAKSLHLPAQLSYERYMRCGFGICGSCARGGWRVCKDGPVKSVDVQIPALLHSALAGSQDNLFTQEPIDET
jgi:dihydroorotate dehydrogenase electron transfer subunit